MKQAVERAESRPSRRSKSGTFRKGQPGNWQEHFTQANKAHFKATAGDLLIRLGYEQRQQLVSTGPDEPFAGRLVRRALRRLAQMARCRRPRWPACRCCWPTPFPRAAPIC